MFRHVLCHLQVWLLKNHFIQLAITICPVSSKLSLVLQSKIIANKSELSAVNLLPNHDPPVVQPVVRSFCLLRYQLVKWIFRVLKECSLNTRKLFSHIAIGSLVSNSSRSKGWSMSGLVWTIRILVSWHSYTLVCESIWQLLNQIKRRKAALHSYKQGGRRFSYVASFQRRHSITAKA
jgi:hypothetical protein